MKEIDIAEFDSVLTTEKGPIVVDVWAEWCGPCRVMGPMLDDLSREYYSGLVKFFKSNVDDNSDLAKRFNVMSIPTLLLFKNGKKVGAIVGAMAPDKLVEKIDETFGLADEFVPRPR